VKAKYETDFSKEKKHNLVNKERATWKGEKQNYVKKSQTSPVGTLEKEDKR
jgi:hypothetical protein